MTTFHLFPFLPFELRAQIWEMTVEPRTVEVSVVSYTLMDATAPPDWRGIRQRRASRPVSPTPVPATLHVCQEARNLRLYQQAFSELDDSKDAETR